MIYRCRKNSSLFYFGLKTFTQSSAGKYGTGFGIGALEEHDIDDEDIYASGKNYQLKLLFHVNFIRLLFL